MRIPPKPRRSGAPQILPPSFVLGSTAFENAIGPARLPSRRTRILALLVQSTCAFGVLIGTGLKAELSREDRARASALFVEYKAKSKAGDRDGAEEAIRLLIEELPGEAAEVVHQEIHKEVKTLLAAYRESVTAVLERSDPKAQLRSKEVRKDRKIIADIIEVEDEAKQKELLVEEGWPALERLDALLLPDGTQLIENDGALELARESIDFRLDLCDELAEHGGLEDSDELRKQLVDFDVASANLSAIASASDRRIIDDNRKVALSGGVPLKDLDGVEDFNRIRILAGFPAMRLDPLLCKAARNHSKDMVQKGFFAHESPVPGRRTPGDRAKEVGTTASGENIAAGYDLGSGANRGWFLSPGHFMNMFRDYKRVGIGSYEETWTQKFGM